MTDSAVDGGSVDSGFCAHHQNVDTVFCADFDDGGPLENGWSGGAATAGGSRMLSDAQAASAPNSFFATVLGGSDAGAAATLTNTFSQTWTFLDVDFDMRPDVPPGAFASVLDVRSDAFSFTMTLGGISCADAGPECSPMEAQFVPRVPVPNPQIQSFLLRVPAASWTHVNLHVVLSSNFVFDAGPSGFLSGTLTVGDRSRAFTTVEENLPGDLTFTLGMASFPQDVETVAHFGDTSNIYFDNVVVKMMRN